MSDLTNEEIIATRKLHGLDDNLFRENIEIGEYVRTADGKIAIFDRYSSRKEESLYKSPFNCFIKLQGRKTPLQCNKDYIVKHSKQLKELIEAEDLCYYKVRGSDTIRKNFATVNTLRKIQLYFYNLEQIEIIKILTHEQIEDNCYKVVKE